MADKALEESLAAPPGGAANGPGGDDLAAMRARCAPQDPTVGIYAQPPMVNLGGGAIFNE